MFCLLVDEAMVFLITVAMGCCSGYFMWCCIFTLLDLAGLLFVLLLGLRFGVGFGIACGNDCACN